MLPPIRFRERRTVPEAWRGTYKAFTVDDSDGVVLGFGQNTYGECDTALKS